MPGPKVKTNTPVRELDFSPVRNHKKGLLAVALAGLMFLGACTATELSDTQIALNDATIILSALEASGTLPVVDSTVASVVITAIQTFVNSQTASATGTTAPITEASAITALTSAITQLIGTTTNVTVLADAKLALAGLNALSTTSTQSAANQANAAALTVLVDYLASLTPKTLFTNVAPAPSDVQKAINDARTHIGHLRTGTPVAIMYSPKTNS